MREKEELKEAERAHLAERCPKALRIIDAADARLKAFENDVHFYVGKLDRIDALPLRWEEESDETGDAGRRAALCDLGEEIADILGGYRERVERLRAEGWTLPSKDEKPKEWAEAMDVKFPPSELTSFLERAADEGAQLMLDVGRRIAEIRDHLQLSQEGLAARLQVSVQWLSRVETGRENLTLMTLWKIANALGVQAIDFLYPPKTDPGVVVRGRPSHSA
jgi:DNA-binding XRE family transcriptional regulator